MHVFPAKAGRRTICGRKAGQVIGSPCKTSTLRIRCRSPVSARARSRTASIMKPIRKAIFPVAGLGTRFLPATKAMPKEMLTVVDRPVIQHVVDEARAAGIEHFVFVTGRNKGVIEDHFDTQPELELILTQRKKKTALDELSDALPEP